MKANHPAVQIIDLESQQHPRATKVFELKLAASGLYEGGDRIGCTTYKDVVDVYTKYQVAASAHKHVGVEICLNEPVVNRQPR